MEESKDKALCCCATIATRIIIRFSHPQKAVSYFQANNISGGVNTNVCESIKALSSLLAERFVSTETQFSSDDMYRTIPGFGHFFFLDNGQGWFFASKSFGRIDINEAPIIQPPQIDDPEVRET